MRITTLLACGSLSLLPVPGLAQTCNITLKDANVWTGAGYEKRSLAITDGYFTAPAADAAGMDASFLYLTPPFADAHNHRIDAANPGDPVHAQALSQGIYYALNPNNIRADGPTLIGRAGLVDLQSAGGGLTRPGGHPQPLYEGLAAGGILGSLTAADLPGKAFHLVATPDEARAAVAKVKAGGAEVIKLYLLDHDKPGGGDGLSAENFAAAVAEAKRLGLMPIVHVESAKDVRVAIAAKVHALVHLPYLIDADRDVADLLLTAEDAAVLAANGIAVVPTVTLSHVTYDGEKLAAIQAVQRHNLKLLKEAGVRIGLGADRWTLNLHDELAFMRALAIFDGNDMINMATANGAYIAFPERRIGRIAEGYEASFLAWFRPLNRAWAEAREPVVGMRGGVVLNDNFGLLAKACPPPEPAKP
jgi:cytosine/adenosine deaminase-related metal-dependent hydrolase